MSAASREAVTFNFESIGAALPYVRRLRALLKEAEDLRNQGIAAVMCHEWGKEMERESGSAPGGHHWDPLADPTSAMLLRRVKHLAFNCGLLREGMAWSNIPKWEDVRILPLYELALRKAQGSGFGEVSLYTQRSSTDLVSPARIMFAATYLRGRLDELGGREDGDDASSALSIEVLRCYYVILREFYTIQLSTGSVGSVRAGGRSQLASSFAGSEAVRAIVHMARSAERTSAFLKRLAATAEYIILVDSTEEAASEYKVGALLSKEWTRVERRRLLESVRALLDGADGQVLVGMSRLLDGVDDEPGSLTRFVEQAAAAAVAFMQETCKNLQLVVKEARRLNKVEQARTQGLAAELHQKDTGTGQRPPELESWSAAVLSQSAHEYISGRLQSFADRVEHDLEHGAEATVPGQLLMAARGLSAAAEGIADLLSPVKARMRADLQEALFSIRATGSASGIVDLAFSAACLGSITRRWEDPGINEAVAHLARALDDGGRVPQGEPFLIVGDRGGALYPANAQVLRAILYICGNTPGTLDPQIADRALRYFSSSAIRVPTEEERAQHLRGAPRSGAAWSQLPGRPGLRASPWMTAAAALCLHRLCSTLRQKLNDLVGVFLDLESAEDLRRDAIPIDELMCSDIGLAAALPNRKMTTEVLEEVRRHLAGRRRKSNTHSLIFYGPPGTGKTTLVRALAASARCSLVTVTPSDLLVRGGELVEAQARAVMEVLSSLTRTVILFDEFDPVIFSRGASARQPESVFSFLTGSMLPKLSKLYESAQENGSAYVLATNYVEDLDEAAIRGGRFDRKILVLPPDAPSRACRLVRVLRELSAFKEPWDEWLKTRTKRENVLGRLLQVAAWSDGIAIEALVGKLAFRRFCETYRESIEWPPVRVPPIWEYILTGKPEDPDEVVRAFPMPVDLRSAKGDANGPGAADNALSVEQSVAASLVAAWDHALRHWCDSASSRDKLPDLVEYVRRAWDLEAGSKLHLSQRARDQFREAMEQLRGEFRLSSGT